MKTDIRYRVYLFGYNEATEKKQFAKHQEHFHSLADFYIILFSVWRTRDKILNQLATQNNNNYVKEVRFHLI